VSLFDSFIKDNDFKKSLDSLNNTISSVPYSTYVDSETIDNNAINTILAAAGDADKGEFNPNSLSEIFKDLEIPADKKERYLTYEAIYNTVQIAKRVITVYLNNTFLRNAISNKIYTIQNIPNVDETKLAEARKFVDEFIKSHDMVKHLKRITRDSLIYGDGYIEVIDLDTVKLQTEEPNKKGKSDSHGLMPITESMMNRIAADAKNKRYQIQENELDRLVDTFLFIQEDGDINDSYTNDLKVIYEEKSGTVDNEMNRFMVRYHSPDKITPIETEYGLTIGYIQITVKDKKNTNASTTNTVQEFMKSIQFSGGFQAKKTKAKGMVVDTDLFVSTLLKKVLKIKTTSKKTKLEDIISSDDIDKLRPDLKWAVKKLLVATGNSELNNKKINVRFIEPSRIHQISYTGGTSVIDTIAYSSKQYMVMQLTNLMSRLSKAASIRKWTLDIGARENASTVVRRLKEELRNQRITATDMTTRDVSKLITDFKDLITISKNGKTYVDVSVDNLGDPSTDTTDLEFQLKEIVAASGVPASYLGYLDSYELRDQLVHANISFANEIMGIQNEVNNAMMSILDNASTTLGNEPISRYISVQLTPPMVLIMQVMETVMNSFSTIYANINDTMQLPTDPIALLEQFVPYVNWKEIVAQGETYKLEKKLKGGGQDQGGGGF